VQRLPERAQHDLLDMLLRQACEGVDDPHRFIVAHTKEFLHSQQPSPGAGPGLGPGPGPPFFR